MLTHKQVETMLDNFMGEKGWMRLKNSEYRGSKNQRPRNLEKNYLVDSGFGVFNTRQPDRIYVQKGTIVVCEIKPEDTSEREIMTGIGQLASLLPYAVKTYLVIPESKINNFSYTFKELPWLGILSFSPSWISLSGADWQPVQSRLQMLHKAERDLSKLKSLPILAPVQTQKNLTREILWEFLRNIQQGKYGESVLKKQIEAAYPNVKVYYQTLAKLLTSMGFEEALSLDEKTYNIIFARGVDESIYTL